MKDSLEVLALCTECSENPKSFGFGGRRFANALEVAQASSKIRSGRGPEP